MKNFGNLLMLAICFFPLTTVGCGGGENTVIEAPAAAVEEEAAMEGMTDEEYDAAMEADMAGEG